MKFLQYLTKLPSLLKNPQNTRFILGNSSADYDSFFGSLIYAFLISTLSGQDYIPLIDCQKQDIPLRFESLHILKHFKINYKDLVYTSDINMKYQNNSFCLYDHNDRQGLRIQQIIDHHSFQERKNSPPSINRIIYPTGSSLTLLYYLMYPKLLPQSMKSLKIQYDDFIKNNLKCPINTVQKDQDIEEIIRYGVLIDCFGFDPNQKDRWTQADEVLIKNIQKNNKTFQISYQELSDLKFNKQLNLNLSIDEHIRRDYKIFQYNIIGKVQYSIICLDPEIFLKYYEKQLLERFKNNSQQYQTFMFMFIWVEKPKDQISEAVYGRQAIFSISPNLDKNKADLISNNIEAIFKDLKMQEKEQFNLWKRWRDPSATISRKKVDKIFRSKL